MDQKYYCSNHYDASVNKYCVKETSLRFWGNKGWIHSINRNGWFQWYLRYWLGRRSVDDKRQIARWKGILTIFKDKLVKMIKDANNRFFDYSISPNIKQILLHWVYELTESDFLCFFFNIFTLLKNDLFFC